MVEEYMVSKGERLAWDSKLVIVNYWAVSLSQGIKTE